MKIEDRVEDLVEQKIADRPDLFVVDITMHPSGLLSILIDGDNGVGIQDCAAISRHVGFHLEEENVIEQAYNLEVSTPGVDTPLVLKRQYNKNIGRSLSVRLKDGLVYEGKLLETDTENIKIDGALKPASGKEPKKGQKIKTEEIVIPHDEITETKVLISFK